MRAIRTVSELGVHGYLTPFSGADAAGIKGPIAADMDTVLLLHMDGSDNGTTFTDSSLGGGDSPHTVSRSATVTKTAVKKFGTASAYFTGTSYLTIPDSADWDFSGDYTIEAWVYLLNVTSDIDQLFVAHTQAGGPGWQFGNVGTGGMGVWDVGSSMPHEYFDQGNITGWTAETWVHVAYVRNGDSFKLYLDGTNVASTTGAGLIPAIAAPLDIGRSTNDTPHQLSGYIDEVRISTTARYTSNFTPPTEAFSA